MRARVVCQLFLLVACCVPITGCSLFSGAEFYLGSSRVAVMLFRGPGGPEGPGGKWYGDHASANQIYQRACAALREGGAIVCQSEKISREVRLHDDDSDPPWIAYGEQLRADYVIVSHLTMWTVGKTSAIGYVPGRAMLNVDVYDVAEKKLTFSRQIDQSIGSGELAEDMFPDIDSGKEALIRLVVREWRRTFIGGE